jgi:hypothetical protein
MHASITSEESATETKQTKQNKKQEAWIATPETKADAF